MREEFNAKAQRHKGGHLTANGQRIEAALPCSLEEFLLAQQLLPHSVVVEHNGEALERARYERTPLAEGDRLELVRAVAGG